MNPKVLAACAILERLQCGGGWNASSRRRLHSTRTRVGARASSAPSPARIAAVRSRRRGLVAQLSMLHEVHQDGFLPRRIAVPRPPPRVQAKGSGLPRHSRGRPARRSSICRLGEASQPIARRTNVSGQCEVLAWRERSPSHQARKAHECRGEGTIETRPNVISWLAQRNRDEGTSTT